MSVRSCRRFLPLQDTPPPDLLREASYNVFKSPAWLAPGGSRDFGALAPGPEATTWIVRRQRPADAAVGIAGSLSGGQGLLPVPNGFARIEDFPAEKVSTNRFGTLRVDEGPGFFALKCRFGPGHGVDSAPDAADLEVPPEEAAAVAAVADELRLANTGPREVLRRLQGFFGENYTYSLERGPRSRGRQHADSPITRFLQRERVGHCEHFATATVLLLRQAGIPARYAAGYAVQERAGAGYVVRGRHAHAWCLAYLDGAWQDFDTTPASWLESDARHAGWLEWLADAWSRLWFEFNKLRYGQSWLQRHAGWLVVGLLLLAVLQLFVGRRWREARREQRAIGARLSWPGLDSEWFELERRLAALGFVRGRGENYTVWLARLAWVPAVGTIQPLLESILALHNRLRFDPLGLSAAERQALRQAVREVLAALAVRAGPAKAGADADGKPE
jgi:transglutaminase-like putative cysteine protease